MSEAGNDYSNETDLPDLVRRAVDLADKLGFKNSSAVPYGRLLRVLASAYRHGRIGESGTGCGVGTAWMASGVSLETPIVTIEIDAERAAATDEMFSLEKNIKVLNGDWKDLGRHGPFDLLFCDGGGKREGQEQVVAMMNPGGMIVLDDLTPGRTGPDDVRDWWLNATSLQAIEISVSPELAAILAVRR